MEQDDCREGRRQGGRDDSSLIQSRQLILLLLLRPGYFEPAADLTARKGMRNSISRVVRLCCQSIPWPEGYRQEEGYDVEFAG